MDHKNANQYSLTNRVGFHYFPDSVHYGEKDLNLWLPRLKQLNAQWLVLNSPTSRAIPEDFVSTLAQAKIKTIIDFNFPLPQEVSWDSLEILLRSYGKWGANYALLNQRPNSQSAWGADFWKQSNLIESHTAQFVQFANLALDCGIKPIFAPMVPAGDFWDLAFLEGAFKILSESADPFLVNNLALSAFAWDFGKSLNWGSGGSQIWKAVKAYKVPKSSQDQCGFRTYEWVLDIANSVFGKKLPAFLFQAGIATDPLNPAAISPQPDLDKQLIIYRLLNGENVYDPENPGKLIAAIAPEVLASNFYLLSAAETQNAPYAWFSAKGNPLSSAQAAFKLIESPSQDSKTGLSEDPASLPKASMFQYGRYILISQSIKPLMQDILKKMHVYITRYKPLIGFSCQEAQKAAYILVIAEDGDFSGEDIELLRHNGSLVRVLHPDDLNTGFTQA
jgi:hypothetical protein